MDCVIDNSAISWLSRIGYLDHLNLIYNNIYGTLGVFGQCQNNNKATNFRKTTLRQLNLDKKQFKRFNKLSRRWKKKLNLDDIVDAEIFVAKYFFDYGDEILTANIRARNVVKKFVGVRDIAELYKVAEEYKIFDRSDTLIYLYTLKDDGYSPADIDKILSEILRK